MTDLQARLGDLIAAYDRQGWHRTGTEGDRQSAEWLGGEAAALGLKPELEPFTLNRIDPLPSWVESEGQRIDGLPFFGGGFTDDAGIEGRIGAIGSQTEIGLVESPPNAPDGPLAEARHRGAHRAVVVVTRGNQPGLALLNAPDFMHPFLLPILQVSSDAGSRLAELAERGARVRVVVRADRRGVRAYNVVTRVGGYDSSAAPVAVMTPRSGWWRCASERGGGLACWIEALRAARESTPRRDVWFLASSGHELGHLGLEAFLAQRPQLVTSAVAWVHFGANIGAAEGSGVRLAASDEALERLATEAMTRAGCGPFSTIARGTVPCGEARNIRSRGGRYISLIGSNTRFHLETDRWPEAVDIDAVARYATASSGLVTALAHAQGAEPPPAET